MCEKQVISGQVDEDQVRVGCKRYLTAHPIGEIPVARLKIELYRRVYEL